MVDGNHERELLVCGHLKGHSCHNVLNIIETGADSLRKPDKHSTLWLLRNL